jgi:hypothetical protein
MVLGLTYDNYADRCQKIRSELEFQLAQAKADGYHSVLISSENLTSLASPKLVSNEDGLEGLHKFLEPYCNKFSIIKTIRRQDLWSVSKYRNAVKRGHIGSSQCLVHVPKLDYNSMFVLWESVFGVEAINPLIFPDSNVKKVGIIESFCKAAGLMEFYQPEHEASFRENVASDSRSIEAVRLLNIEAIGSAGGPFPLTALRKRVEFLLENQVFEGPIQKIAPARADAEAFMERYAEGNEALRARYFGDSKTLFQQDFSKYPEHAVSPTPDVQDLIRLIAMLTLDKKIESKLSV